MSTTLYAEAEAQLGTRDSRKIGNNGDDLLHSPVRRIR